MVRPWPGGIACQARPYLWCVGGGAWDQQQARGPEGRVYVGSRCAYDSGVGYKQGRHVYEAPRMCQVQVSPPSKSRKFL